MFIKYLKNNVKKETENGAIGYETSSSYLVDLNFRVPSFRNCIDTDLFEKSFEKEPNYTLRWLLYLRDIKNGIGERKSFRDFMVYFFNKYPERGIEFINNVDIAEFGRWDDVIYLFFNCENEKVKGNLIRVIYKQFGKDIRNCMNNKPISLLAKWMPSINASSVETVEMAKTLASIFGLTHKRYRKTLSYLREYLNVVEKKMSKNEWSDIDYEKVPSKANLVYSGAFMEHDYDRRVDYLGKLEKGEAKINADSMFLHDIVNKYENKCGFDSTLEELWKAQKKCEGFSNTLVVRDGSGSMECDCINGVTPLTVANAITLYCAENNTGEYKDKFITFSSRPRLLDVSKKKSLYDKLKYLIANDDCTNTDIEKVFELILSTAVKNNVPGSDMPKSVLIISD